MDAIGTISRPGRTSGFGGAIARAARAGVNILLTWQDRVRERHVLAHADAHMLRDLGLSRADVVRELDKPFWQA